MDATSAGSDAYQLCQFLDTAGPLDWGWSGSLTLGILYTHTKNVQIYTRKTFLIHGHVLHTLQFTGSWIKQDRRNKLNHRLVTRTYLMGFTRVITLSFIFNVKVLTNHIKNIINICNGLIINSATLQTLNSWFNGILQCITPSCIFAHSSWTYILYNKWYFLNIKTV